MNNNWLLSPDRNFTDEERAHIWKKPASHVNSEAEMRISSAVANNWNRGEMKITNILLEGDAGSGKTQLAKALSYNFQLPYTKITCFADMDKSDILGSILPVDDGSDGIKYKYYPSEIVRAYENGWLLEIQEPTVIRDAAVLMALNSALEPDGSLNLPTRTVKRHPDFVVVITTNRGYNGCRPLNEALRDRVQHAEKLDLPPISVMVERAASKTGCDDLNTLETLAKAIVKLDSTSKANAIKGVAGMRSYFYWIDALLQGIDVIDSMYHKVIYKMTTDDEEIKILEEALKQNEIIDELENISKFYSSETVGEEIEMKADGSFDVEESEADEDEGDRPTPFAIKRSEDSEGHSEMDSKTSTASEQQETGTDGSPIYHELSDAKELEEEKRSFRKSLNTEARKSVKGSMHEKIGMIVHRPESTEDDREEYEKMVRELAPIIEQLSRRTLPLLEYEESSSHSTSKVYGTRFHAEKIASQDFRYFSKKNPPDEEASLAVALRIDQSASMNAFGRLDAAKKAAVAVYEFCVSNHIPVLIYGDTADASPREKMSVYSYIDWDAKLNNPASLMGIKALSNNRDGMALKIIAEKLVSIDANTKLLISISDGQPMAIPDYSGDLAITDMKDIIGEYRRKGILFTAAAIGQDKETISDIYGQERFLDITNLDELPTRLVQTIARYL